MHMSPPCKCTGVLKNKRIDMICAFYQPLSREIIFSRAREVRSPGNPLSAGADWRNQPFSLFKVDCSVKLTCMTFLTCMNEKHETMLKLIQNTKTGWAWDATICLVASVCLRATLCTSWVQDYIVHHRSVLCTTNLCCAPWSTRETYVHEKWGSPLKLFIFWWYMVHKKHAQNGHFFVHIVGRSTAHL